MNIIRSSNVYGNTYRMKILNFKKRVGYPIHIEIDRDSVCAGDDISSHSIEFNFESTASISDLLRKVRTIRYLAHIQGGKATWVIFSNNIEIAIVAQQWSSPRFIIDEKTAIRKLSIDESSVSLYFKYFVQKDPECVYQEIMLKLNCVKI